jgi:prepilin-type N-terminal cleavage/methylation domain-containing protein
MQRRPSVGFTLIELLIVVAIIAILAAIAVPNFLEAQTRSKVSKVYADFRTIATALESYRTDNTAYVLSHGPGQGDDFIAGTQPLNRLRPLTTPVAYLGALPDGSPFASTILQPAYYVEYQYSTKVGLLKWGRGGWPDFPVDSESNAYLNGYYRLAAGRQVDFQPGADRIFRDGPDWMLLDRGPDQIFYFIWRNPGWVGLQQPSVPYTECVVFYDPTNGTVSAGEIMRSQMLSSFR